MITDGQRRSPALHAAAPLAWLLLLVVTFAPEGGLAQESSRAPQARPAWVPTVREGLELLEKGAAAAALPLLEEYDQGPLDDLVAFARGRGLLEKGEPAAAAEALAQVADDGSSPWRPEARRARATALKRAGKQRLARRALADLVDRFPAMPERPGAMLALADVELELGRKRPAAEILARLTWEHPSSEAAAIARQRLQELETTRIRAPEPSFRDYLDRASVAVRERRYDDAREALESAEKLAGRSQQRREAVLDGRLGLWMRAEDYARVRDALHGMRYHPEENATRGLQLAKALLRSGETDEGLGILALLQRRTSAVSWAQYARALQAEGRLDQAHKAFHSAYRVKREAISHRWELAWIDYRRGEFERALEGFMQVARRHPRLRARARYWKARTLQALGRRDEAVADFQEIAQDLPLDYYGYLARSRLLDMGEGDADYESWAAKQGPEAAAPVAVWESLPHRPTPKPEALVAGGRRHAELFPRWERAALLYELDRPDDARHEMRLLLDEWRAVRRKPRYVSRLVGTAFSGYIDRRKPPAGKWGEPLEDVRIRLSSLERKRERARLRAMRDVSDDVLGALREALRVVEDPWGVRVVTFALAGYDQGPPTAATRAFYADAYPCSWRELVLENARIHELDPALVWAVMTVESAHQETAHSVANARGLIQLLPRTAALVSRDRGEPPPAPAALVEPATNLRLGTWYLAKLIERFRGQVPFALAAYNAGPHRVAWRIDNLAGLPLDVAIEEIPASRGREYAKKVLRYNALYRRIHLGDGALYVGGKTLKASPEGISY